MLTSYFPTVTDVRGLVKSPCPTRAWAGPSKSVAQRLAAPATELGSLYTNHVNCNNSNGNRGINSSTTQSNRHRPSSRGTQAGLISGVVEQDFCHQPSFAVVHGSDPVPVRESGGEYYCIVAYSRAVLASVHPPKYRHQPVP